MTEPCGNCEVCSRCVNADAELHEQFGQLTAERDALRVVSKACRERNEVLVKERDALRRRFEDAQDYCARVERLNAKVEGERDALKRDKRDMRVVAENLAGCKADNERLRRAVLNEQDAVQGLTSHLTELRAEVARLLNLNKEMSARESDANGQAALARKIRASCERKLHDLREVVQYKIGIWNAWCDDHAEAPAYDAIRGIADDLRAVLAKVTP